MKCQYCSAYATHKRNVYGIMGNAWTQNLCSHHYYKCEEMARES